MTRAIALTVAAIAVIAALFFARPHSTPGPLMRDFEAYYAAGAVYDAGGDPYSLQIWNAEKTIPGVNAARYEVLPFIGPPATLPLWGALARLPWFAAAALWRGLLTCSALLLLLAALRIAGIPLRPYGLFAGAIVALGFGPLTSAVALGQIALPAVAAAAFAVAWRSRGGTSAAFATLIAWAQPNLALALAGAVRNVRTAVAIGTGTVAFFVLCAAIVGSAHVAAYLHALAQHGGAERFSAIQITPAAIAYGFGVPAAAAQTIGTCVAIAAIVFWLLRITRTRDVRESFAITALLLPIAAPFFHEHDLLVVLAPALFIALRAPERVWPVALGGTLLCAIDWLGIAQRPDGAPQSLLLMAAAALGLMALRNDFRAPSWIAAAIPAALLIGAAFAAPLHAAPVWPDAMRGLVNASGPSAVVWHAEQVASGLLEPNAFWALLRCGSLLGCAVLAGAATIRDQVTARPYLPEYNALSA